jgi:hypothetical protein
MSDETTEITPEIGTFMVHSVLDFICTEKGAAAFTEFIDEHIPEGEKTDPNRVRENAKHIHDWWISLSSDALAYRHGIC